MINDIRLTRRQALGLGTAMLAGGDPWRARAASVAAPVRRITSGPRHHWFGYYDKLQFDPAGRFVLGMEVAFEHRSPKADDVINVGMVDLKENDRWIGLGQSRAWCWQQGCMLQWVPGSAGRILWNDREGDRFVCRILDTRTGEGRTVPHPVYSVSPDGKTAVSPDFARINDCRPGYGYTGLADQRATDLAPGDTGIFRIDLEKGTSELIISLKRIAGIGRIPQKADGIKHYFNHLLFSPDGSRFIALHRWRYPNGRRLTRMITARPDGSELRVLDDNGYTSHFIWRDSGHILAQSDQPSHGRANYLFEDKPGGRITAVGPNVLDRSGHISYLPGHQWILSDTYPDDERMQVPHLFHVPTSRRIDLGRFPLPKEYTGEWRCDTHPRFSRDGRMVCIDTPAAKMGRQLHLIDIGEIVKTR